MKILDDIREDPFAAAILALMLVYVAAVAVHFLVVDDAAPTIRVRTNIRVSAGETTVWCTMTEEDGDVEFSDCAPRPVALP